MALSEMGVSDHTGGSGSVYRRAADSGFTEIEAAGRVTGQNIWLTRMRSDNSGFHVGKGEYPLCARNGTCLHQAMLDCQEQVKRTVPISTIRGRFHHVDD